MSAQHNQTARKPLSPQHQRRRTVRKPIVRHRRNRAVLPPLSPPHRLRAPNVRLRRSRGLRNQFTRKRLVRHRLQSRLLRRSRDRSSTRLRRRRRNLRQLRRSRPQRRRRQSRKSRRKNRRRNSRTLTARRNCVSVNIHSGTLSFSGCFFSAACRLSRGAPSVREWFPSAAEAGFIFNGAERHGLKPCPSRSYCSVWLDGPEDGLPPML
jgi:hypothetical protein